MPSPSKNDKVMAGRGAEDKGSQAAAGATCHAVQGLPWCHGEGWVPRKENQKSTEKRIILGFFFFVFFPNFWTYGCQIYPNISLNMIFIRDWASIYGHLLVEKVMTSMGISPFWRQPFSVETLSTMGWNGGSWPLKSSSQSSNSIEHLCNSFAFISNIAIKTI